jgi:RND family efflux transporter MFP subunit
MGDSFLEGETLVELDSGIYKANLLRGEAAVAKTHTVYQAKQKLFEQAIASESEVKDAFALYATAQAELEIARKQYASCFLTAPFNGKVVNTLLMEHELPQAGQPIIEIVGDEVILAKMLITANHLRELTLNKPIRIFIRELNRSVEANIKRIGPVIDPSSSTISVEAEMDNNSSRLIAGMLGKVNFGQKPDDIAVNDKGDSSKPEPLPKHEPLPYFKVFNPYGKTIYYFGKEL